MNPRSPSQGYTDSHGYARISAPGHPRADRRGTVPRSWLVVEARDGTPMALDEIVIFRDGDRRNLAPENLLRVRRRSAFVE